MSEQVQKNKMVTFVYSIADEKGEILEQSEIPHSYLHDQDARMFPKVMRELTGHKVGDAVEITLSPDEGFGYHDLALTYTDELKNVPPEYQRLGAEAQFRDAAGESMTMRVTRIENGQIELDGNPPFVGKTVVFSINILEIRDATEREISAGRPAEDPAQTSTLNHTRLH